jgi:hypothetical protein
MELVEEAVDGADQQIGQASRTHGDPRSWLYGGVTWRHWTTAIGLFAISVWMLLAGLRFPASAASLDKPGPSPHTL